MSFYELLGVPRSADVDQIKRAYRANMAAYHPDVNPAPNATRLTALLNEAWETLSDPTKRATYDSSLDSHRADAYSTPHRPAPEPTQHEPPASPRTLATKLKAWAKGLVLIAVGVWFVILGDKPGPDYNGWFVFLFWVCVLSGAYTIAKATKR